MIFISGDNVSAKEIVTEIIKEMNFAPIDLGSLQAGGRLQDVGNALSGIELVKMERN